MGGGGGSLSKIGEVTRCILLHSLRENFAELVIIWEDLGGLIVD